MPEMNGIEAYPRYHHIEFLLGKNPQLCSHLRRDEYAFTMLWAPGQRLFLKRDADPDEIVAAIRVVARGDALRSSP